MNTRVKKVLLSLPAPMVEKLDQVAAKQKRTRSAEVGMRLAASLKGMKLHSPNVRRSADAAK